MIVDKIKKRGESAKKKESKVDIPIGKWVKCEECKEIIYKEKLRANLNICPHCGNYFRMHIARRLESIIDEGTYKRFDLNIDTTNPLDLEDYPRKLKSLRDKTGLEEAVATGTGKINGEYVDDTIELSEGDGKFTVYIPQNDVVMVELISDYSSRLSDNDLRDCSFIVSNVVRVR